MERSGSWKSLLSSWRRDRGNYWRRWGEILDKLQRAVPATTA
jgi:hypothetical protein